MSRLSEREEAVDVSNTFRKEAGGTHQLALNTIAWIVHDANDVKTPEQSDSMISIRRNKAI